MVPDCTLERHSPGMQFHPPASMSQNHQMLTLESVQGQGKKLVFSAEQQRWVAGGNTSAHKSFIEIIKTFPKTQSVLAKFFFC